MVERVGLLCEVKRKKVFFLFQNLGGSLEFNSNRVRQHLKQ